MRQIPLGPECLAVAPVTATIPGFHGNRPYSLEVPASGPTLTKRCCHRREPGHRQLGTAAHQGEALAVGVPPYRGAGTPHRTPSHLCDTTRTRAETRSMQAQEVPRGGFQRRGKTPAFGDSFPHFSSGRNGAQRSVPPGWQACSWSLGAGQALPSPPDGGVPSPRGRGKGVQQWPAVDFHSRPSHG